MSFTHFVKNVRKTISKDLKLRAVKDYVFTKNSLQEVVPINRDLCNQLLKSMIKKIIMASNK